jgi:hypothetical protein
MHSAATVNLELARHKIDVVHCRIMGGQDDAWCGAQGRFNHTNNIRDTQTRKERPHGKVLESGRARREIVNQRIIFHIDSDKVVEAGRRERQNARDFLGMEEIGGFVPVLLSHVSWSLCGVIRSTWPWDNLTKGWREDSGRGSTDWPSMKWKLVRIYA